MYFLSHIGLVRKRKRENLHKYRSLIPYQYQDVLRLRSNLLVMNGRVNPSYMRSWLDLLSRTPRMAPFLSKDNPFILALKKELANHVVEVNLQHDVLDGMFTFYDSTINTLQIYRVASVTFDLLLLLVLGSYLITLFSFLVITTRGVDDLISLFRRPPPRKVKSV